MEITQKAKDLINILTKAGTVLDVQIPIGGTLLHEQAKEWIQDVVAENEFLQMCKSVTTRKKTLDMNVFEISEQLSYRPTQTNVADTSRVATQAQKLSLTNVGNTAELKRLMTVADMDYDTIEDNQDMGADYVLNMLIEMVTKQRARDEADLAILGTTDTWVADTFYTNNKGFIQLAKDDTKVYKWYNTSDSDAIVTLKSMLAELPTKYRNNANLKYLVSYAYLDTWIDLMASKEGLGIFYVTGQGDQYHAIKVQPVAFMPLAVQFLCDPGKDFGIVRNLEMRRNIVDKPEINLVRIILNQMIDFQFVVSARIVLSWGGTPGAPTITCDPVSCAHASTVEVTIATAGENEDQNSTIYYTDDGTTPDNTDNLYSAAFDVTSTKTIKAIVYKSGQTGSVTTQVVTIA